MSERIIFGGLDMTTYDSEDDFQSVNTKLLKRMYRKILFGGINFSESEMNFMLKQLKELEE